MDQAASQDRMTVQGVEIELIRRGAGPPMLLLHGGGGCQAKAPFFGRLCERFDVIAPTHPGFSALPLPDHFDSVHDLAYLYLDLMDQLAIERAVVMGFSLGGWLACEIAIRNTARIAKLILVDSVGIKPGNREARDIADIFAIPAETQQRLLFHDPSKLPPMASLPEAELVAAMRNRQALALYGWEPYLHNPKLLKLLHRIDVPTLVLWGASDGLVRPDYGRALAAAIPEARFVVIPEAGHSPQAEQPDAFVAHVLRFAGA